MLRTCLIVVAVLGLAALPRPAGAEAAAARARPEAGSLLERVRLQSELNRINAEIDALKRHPRGIRDDYRLRSRMADAEAIARRLTDLDARIGPGPAPPPSPGAALAPPEIRVSPSDDRAEREAKADILADQARRLTIEANRLEGRVVGLRSRNELKRRAGQLERDPFSPLEQAKGRVGVTTGAAPVTFAPKSNGTQGGGGVVTPSVGATDGRGSIAPSGSGASPPPTATPSPPPTTTPTTIPTTTAPQMPVTQDAAGSPTSTSQLRGVLDPASLEEVRRLEAPGAGPANLELMERALDALRARAAQLSASATALRVQAPRSASP